MTLKNIKISSRMLFGFATMGLLIAALGAVSFLRVEAIGSDLTLVLKDSYPKVAELQEIALGIRGNARVFRDLLLQDDVRAQNTLDLEMKATTTSVVAHLKTLEATIRTAEGIAMLHKVNDARTDYAAARTRFFTALRAKDRPTAVRILYEQVNPGQQAYQSAVQNLIGHEERRMTAASDVAAAAVTNTKIIVGATVAVSLLFAAGVGIWITRSTTRPLAVALKIAQSVAKGDLSLPFDSSGSNETSQLLGALKTMQTNLASVVRDVRRNSEGVATASAEIAQGNNDLSSRTEQQASALQQTASSMEQLGATVKQNADSARQGNQLALQASTVAEQGGIVVGEVVETMKGINDSSKRIADIIGVIDSIAFQTNILALNAAVEAARAGEQGRGFAVVASEVRSLAQRSAAAAKEIKDLIGTSVERVGQGTRLVDKAGATMNEVVVSIKRVTDIMGEISAASTEQSSGVAQVGEAVSQMDQTTQQNAALVEQSAAAAQSLKAQAAQLVEAVAVFRLGKAGESVAVAVAASPALVTPRISKPAVAVAPVGTPAVALTSAGAEDDWQSF